MANPIVSNRQARRAARGAKQHKVLDLNLDPNVHRSGKSHSRLSSEMLATMTDLNRRLAAIEDHPVFEASRLDNEARDLEKRAAVLRAKLAETDPAVLEQALRKPPTDG